MIKLYNKNKCALDGIHKWHLVAKNTIVTARATTLEIQYVAVAIFNSESKILLFMDL